jgi:polyisoprenoid-binding protein YceI
MNNQFDWLNNRTMPYNRPNGWVRLDRAWARRLGVTRDRGVYRIRHRDLLNRIDPLAGSLPMSGSWKIDPQHTRVGFVAPHLMVAKVRGGFRDVAGTVSVGTGAADSWVEVTVDTASIDTGQPVRDAHLRSADFLDSDNHPHMRFKSTGLEICGSSSARVTGDLTLKGVTRPVTFDLQFLGRTTDENGRPKVAFDARASIDREEFGLVWNRVLEAGGVLVGRQIELQIEAQAIAA